MAHGRGAEGTTASRTLAGYLCGSAGSESIFSVAFVRFLSPFRANLVNVLREVFPALAEKVRRLSDEQFRRLHEELTRQKRGSA